MDQNEILNSYIYDIKEAIDNINKCEIIAELNNMPDPVICIEYEIGSIELAILSIIELGLTEKEYNKIYATIIGSKYALINNKYTQNNGCIGKDLFIKTMLLAYNSIISLKLVVMAAKIEPSDLSYMKAVKFNSNETLKSLMQKFEIAKTWIKRKKGFSDGGKKASTATEALELAIRYAIASTGDTSLKPIWKYFKNYTIDDPLEIDDFEIYLDYKDENEKLIKFKKQKIIIVKDHYIKTIQPMSLYKRIQSAINKRA